MRVMGIDCGGEYTGYGVVEQLASRELVRCVSGAIKLKTKDPMPLKLQRIYSELTAIIHEYRPELVAISDQVCGGRLRTGRKAPGATDGGQASASFRAA